MTSPQVSFIRMNPQGRATGPGTAPLIFLSTPTPSVIEGSAAQVNLRRIGNATGFSSIDWNLSAPANTITGALTGTVTFAPGETVKPITITTVEVLDELLDRTITVTLSNAVGCEPDPDADVLQIVVRDRPAIVSDWFKQPTRSGRAVPSGATSMVKTDYDAFQSAIALHDMVGGFSWGTNFNNVQTWDQVVGDPAPAQDGALPLSFNNPWNKLSATRRPIGLNAVWGYGGGCTIVNWNAGNKAYTEPTFTDDAEIRRRLGDIELSDEQGRKGVYIVAPGDPDVIMTLRGGSATVALKMPLGDTSRAAGGGVYYPPYRGGDNVSGFGPRNGVAGGLIVDAFNEFDYVDKTYSEHTQYDISGTDVGGGLGASNVKWLPGMILMGSDLRDPNPAKIRKVLQVTGTRHNRADGSTVTALDHLLNANLMWPATRIDGSANPQNTGFNPDDNKGIFPYCALLGIERPIRDMLKADLRFVNRPRCKVLFDQAAEYGWRITDGQGQQSTKPGPKGVLIVRTSVDFGRNLDGTTADPQIEIDAAEAFSAMAPYVKQVINTRPHLTETELHTDNLPYSGGGGPPDNQAVNTAYDANPGTTGSATAHQFNWNDGSTRFGTAFNYFPTTDAVNGAGWIAWMFCMFPVNRRTDTGSSAVLDEIIAGTHDAKFQLMGTRVKDKFAARGIPLKRFIGIPNPGMNAAFFYQVFPSTRAKYKVAAERMAAQMRIGADFPELRFAHIVAKTPEIGPLVDWCPSNFDAIGMIVHPDATVIA